MKKFLSVFILLIVTICYVSADATTSVSPSGSGLPRFIVISDIHFGSSDAKTKVAKALQGLASKTPRADAIFVVGDLTDYGRKSQYDDLKEIFSAHVPGNIPVYFMMGNHDHFVRDENGEDNYLAELGQPLHQYIHMQGYPFITISMSRSGYDQRGMDFLTSSLADAAAKYPGKPIFVFTHVGVINTVYGTGEKEGWGTGFFEQVLNQYPQAVVFSGHSHYPLGDPRSIHQGRFTSINDGSTTYGEIETGFSEGIHPPGYRNVTEGVIVSLKENGDVEIERWDTYRNEEILPQWTIKAPHDGTAFTFKNRTGDKSPQFPAGEKPAVTGVETNECVVSFAQAKDDEVVHHYLIEATPADGNTGISATVFSQFYLNSNMPGSLSYKMPGLRSGTAYTVSIKAVDSYNNQSTPVVSDRFTTLVYEPDPSVAAPVSRLFDVTFNPEGAADQSVQNNSLVPGAFQPVISFDPSINSYMATFTGSGKCHYKLWYRDNAAIKSVLPESFSLEIYYRPAAQGGCPVSAQESGGVGVEQSGFVPQLWAYIDGGYKQTGYVPISSAQFYHVVFTYDQTKGLTAAYIDGAPAGKNQVKGKLSFPSDERAHWFGIGGDASTSDEAQFAFKGDIAYTRLYDHAVSRDEVFRLFEQTLNRKKLTNVDELVRLLTVDIPQKIDASNRKKKALLKEKYAEGWRILSDYSSTQDDIEHYIANVRKIR